MKKEIQKKAATWIAMLAVLTMVANPALAHEGHEGESHPVDLGEVPLNNDQPGGESTETDVPAAKGDVPGAGEQGATTTTQGGPIILMGIDAEDGGPNGHGPISVYQEIVRNILTQVKNGRSGILVLGGGKSATDNVTRFWNEIGKGTGQRITYLNGATNLANQPFIGYAMIGVASDAPSTPSGGLTQAEHNALAMRQPNIAQFVNDGGALLGFSSDLRNPYAYMGGIGSFRVRTGMNYSNIDPTTDGIAIGVTNSLDIPYWHDVYLSFPSFLKVLAYDHSSHSAASIGGAGFKVVAVDEAPVVTATPDRSANSNGWYKSDVTVTFTAKDEDDTPVQTVDAPKTVSAEGKDMEIIGMAVDTAGYKGWGSVKVSIDKTAPTAKAELLPSVPDGVDGNYQSDVTVSLIGSDNLSGIDAVEYSINGGVWTSATGSLTFSAHGDYRIDYRPIDKAGNVGQTASTSFKIVKESFEVTPTFDQTPNSNGWYNGPVTVTLNPGTSGATIQYQIDNGDWITYTGPFVVDVSCHLKFRVISRDGTVGPVKDCHLLIDLIAPRAYPVLNPSVPNGGNGWYTTSPTIELVGTDDLSGMESIEYRIDGGAWIENTGGFNLPHDGTCTIEYRLIDNAGNVGSGQFQINLDTAAPASSLSITPPDGKGGWYVSAPIFVLTGQDRGSGVGTIEYRIDNGDWIVYTGPTPLSHSCKCKIEYRTTDQAGNVSPVQYIEVNVDLQAPATTATFDPSAPNGSNGWYTTSPTIELVGTDDLSGMERMEYRIDDGAWMEYTGGFRLPHDCTCKIVYRSIDNAGNAGSGQFHINLDTTAPTASVSITPPDGEGGWYVTAPTFVLNGQDGSSGVGTIEYRIDNGEWMTYTGPTPLSHSCKCKIWYRTTDQAGNVSPEQSIDVNIDLQAPTTTATVDPSAPNGENGWYTSGVTIRLEGNDDTSGCKKTQCRVVPAGGTPGDWFDYTGPIVLSEGGDYTIEYRTVDHAGNAEPIQSLPIHLDNTAPTTDLVLNPSAPNGNGWYNTPVTVALPANDGVSGVSKTVYRVTDGDQIGEWTEYTGPFPLPHNCGCHLEYYSTDQAGNAEPPVTATIPVDTTAPTLKISLANQILWPPNHKYVPIQLKVEATDNLSGIEKIELVSIKSNESDEWLGDGHHTDDIIDAVVGTLDTEFQVRSERSGLLSGRTYTATYKATDKAGNVTIASYTITVPHDMRDKIK